ncbi:uncharacterized protein M421DRAFT_100364 [Didymella exigua CBS 183.55]|uniref:Zn(2)-C6 fungal-type domain-containing protein n=1 Tax=Didymella exigua CBS 183.55 TaxID=1150837 RepID=A0A6A5RNI8_9PLEO|nr:uncharacterized protein M421DRAFT_100364 [Didymella exigua CBS 183.55]KAF1929219.1 hypothetical protein M421DRAFT_100364 [Didymella exigua CBS 183.55]
MNELDDASDLEEVDVSNGRNQQRPDDSAGPACQACRKKKAKCSRETPCSQCIKNGTSCLYDKDKGRPGMKAGAIERLTRRLDVLENMFLGQGLLWQQVWNAPQSQHNQQSPPISIRSDLSGGTEQVRQFLESLGQKRARIDDHDISTGPNTKKKPRTQDAQHRLQTERSQSAFANFESIPADLLDSLVEIYFARIHPWIPVLHVRQFRRQLNSESRDDAGTILCAITSTCVRFSDNVRFGTAAERFQLAQSCRQSVILQSMESFSVTNLQALIICAFDIIGSGRGPSAWSIVGSMARTVEQLQLSIEDEDPQHMPSETKVLVKRMKFLRPCQTWSEREERCRVFWNVFLMDRFCSVTTGWNVCLTSAEVRRRLPCEGALWEEGNPLHILTPFFGVSGPPEQASSQLPNSRSETADQASLGGFAYCIEATENLSLVTSFFLQQAVDVARVHDIQVWLMRFKQLDLRLIQWKLYLPERWRQACALNDDGNMDPNLTLAHITHNTAVVLLHQGIAYPSSEWQSVPINLPSASSADTCLAAAIEVSIIAEELLRNTDFLTNPQFAFCLFVCGRMLIAHSFYCQNQLPLALDNLVNSLHEMSRRWNGLHSASTENLASKFALRLEHARKSGLEHADMRQAAYFEDQAPSVAVSPRPDENNARGDVYKHSSLHHSLGTFGEVLPLPVCQGESPDSITLAFPPLPLAFEAQSTSEVQGRVPPAVMLNGEMQDPGAQYHQDAHLPSEAPLGNNITFENMASYLDYPFLPDQRVSAFSNPQGM